MISASDRQQAVILITEAMEAGARKQLACDELNISTRTFDRWRSSKTPLEDQRPMAVRPAPANKLKPEEEQAVLQLLNSKAYRSSPPSTPLAATASWSIGCQLITYLRTVTKILGRRTVRSLYRSCTKGVDSGP